MLLVPLSLLELQSVGHSDCFGGFGEGVGPYILEPCLHIDTEYLGQILTKMTYRAAQQNDLLKLNVLGYFIFSSTYQKQLSSNYGIQSLPVSILDTYVSGFISSKPS